MTDAGKRPDGHYHVLSESFMAGEPCSDCGAIRDYSISGQRDRDAVLRAEAIAEERARIRAGVIASDWLSSTILRIIEGADDAD